MEKYFLVFLCSSAIDAETMNKCQQALKITIRELHLYQSLKEKERYYRLMAEDKLTRPGFWAASTIISSVSTKRLYLTGHNVMGIDSVNLKLGRDSELALTWTF